MASDSEPDDDGLDIEDEVEDYQDNEDDGGADGPQDDVTEEGDEVLGTICLLPGIEDELLQDSASEDSEDSSEDEGDDSSEPSGETLADLEPEPSITASEASSQSQVVSQSTKVSSLPSPSVTRKRSRSLSPASIRKKTLTFATGPPPRTYTVEAICALPHPVPTHALAASACMTHLLTGSDDGYIRNYDIFTAVNGKNFLTAPQRHHAAVVEGIMKSGQLRFDGMGLGEEEPVLSPVYSLAMHSDALWTLAGNDVGHINLFTTRHDPGRCCHGFYSAGWDGDAMQWDLNTGRHVRSFTAHGAQLACVAVRPLNSHYIETSQSESSQLSNTLVDNSQMDVDSKSDASFDPLFDDEEETETAPVKSQSTKQAPVARAIAPPKNAPPLLDTGICGAFSPDIIMTASIDGQVILWDKRAHTPGTGVGRLWMSDKTPPWCLSGPNSVPRLLKTLRNPTSSGVVSCIVAFPDGKHIASASIDNLRLWNAAEAAEPDSFGKMKSGVQFKIIPGHHGGYISQLLVDPATRFLVSASSNRGWHGDSTKTVFVHDIKRVF
ncbi:WD40-repeat-containing domain protein [Roridomyces roridus]|uniref:WD40-repeat-containing domain protein n=1 Tax=Roridomyces roridus TaxID=1738132 RepID=A0AAD7C607_9AGAR|nr:WD40-repeat-containing domain protein [Roridomyces roridus]